MRSRLLSAPRESLSVTQCKPHIGETMGRHLCYPSSGSVTMTAYEPGTVPGIDTPQQPYVAIVKLNLATEEHAEARTVLTRLNACTAHYTGLSASIIAGFSARFFKGPLTERRDSCQ